MSTLHRRALLSLTAGAGLLAAGCANTTSSTSTATPLLPQPCKARATWAW